MITDPIYLEFDSTPFLLKDRRLYSVHIDGTILRARGVDRARVLQRSKIISREKALELAMAGLQTSAKINQLPC